MKSESSTTTILLNRLQGALGRGARSEINGIVATLLQRSPPLGEKWRSLAMVMEHNGEVGAALAALDAYVAGCRTDPSPGLLQVYLLQRAGKIIEAKERLAMLPTTVPDPATNLYLRGVLEITLGNFALGVDHLDRASVGMPDSGPVWLALATAVDLSKRVDIADRIVDRDPRRAGRLVQTPAAYFYALGKVYSDQGQPAAAFEAYDRGARIVQNERPFSAEADARVAASARAGYDADTIAAVARTVTTDTSRPIIVTGHPRSGTSLVEQILTSHSAVADGGELGLMRVIGLEIGGHTARALGTFVERQRHGADELARLYLHLLSERFDRRGRIVDKTLSASRTLGLIASILPAAPIVWMRRDALDTAWSCFRTYFPEGMEWSWSQQAIAAHFRIEDTMLSYWQATLGNRLMVLDYEDLVSEPHRAIPRMMAHCGLSMEAQVLHPERTDRAVRTASVAQVRSPISTAGIGAAAPARRHLQPFIDAYGYAD